MVVLAGCCSVTAVTATAGPRAAVNTSAAVAAAGCSSATAATVVMAGTVSPVRTARSAVLVVPGATVAMPHNSASSATAATAAPAGSAGPAATAPPVRTARQV